MRITHFVRRRLEQTFPGEGLFRSYFLIILTYSRLHGANQQSRVFGAWKGKERAWWIMLTFFTKGLFSAVVALVSWFLLWAKACYIVSSPSFEELQYHTELNGLPSWRTDGCGEALVKIALNKILWKLSLTMWQKKVGLPSCHLQRLAPLSPLSQLKIGKK